MKTNTIWLLAILLGLGIIRGQAAVGKGAQALLQNSSQLSLSARQRSEISAVVRRTVAEFNRIRQAERGRPELAAKLDGLRQASQKEALKLLSPEQQRQWKKLASPTGAPRSKPASSSDRGASKSLLIPTIAEMRDPPSPGAFGSTTGIMPTKAHAPQGEGYVIVTDHKEPVARQALDRLATHRKGKVICVPSLGELFKQKGEFDRLKKSLRKLMPRFVAVAPVVDSYRENMHLSVLKLLTGLDDDPELDAFLGYLIASDAASLAALVERTLNFQALRSEQLAPASIGAIEDMDARRYRSYQKAKVVQRMFAEEGTESPAIIITTRKSHTERDDFPKLAAAEKNIAMLPASERHTFASLSAPAKQALNRNNLLFMFGHGTPERIVGTRVSAFAQIDFSNELVFCGSCYSASPYRADRHDLSDKKGKRFAFHAMDNGAVMMLGHMGLCGGFPVVYPMAEHVLAGLSTGEAYQRIMNARIGGQPIPDYYPEPAPPKADRRSKGNGLLYVLWGDPALTPIVK
ncbi:MAG: hypothetical protein ACPGVU_09965 [Limisphaerales bacterium]